MSAKKEISIKNLHYKNEIEFGQVYLSLGVCFKIENISEVRKRLILYAGATDPLSIVDCIEADDDKVLNEIYKAQIQGARGHI